MRTALALLVLAAVARGQDLPDLVVYGPALAQNAREELKAIAPDDCTLQAADRCVDAPGTRKLLRFSVLALNRGTADLFLGTPSAGDPRFVYSACHRHFHFESFARYELRPRGASTPVRTGQKRSFCIEDLRADPDHPAARPCTTDVDCDGHGQCANGVCQYNCNYQGIQPGRGDIYESNLDCQWIDTTDVPPGDYDLWVFLNTEQLLPESDYTNDAAMVPVAIGPVPGTAPPVVKVHAKRRSVRVGKALKLKWKVRAPGGADAVDLVDVRLSRDGGATFPELLATGLGGRTRSFAWTAVGDASTQAVVEVTAWTSALQHGSGRTRPLRIRP